MSWIRGKLADHVGGHVVLSPEEGVLVTSAGTESSYPRPPQSLNNSKNGKKEKKITKKCAKGQVGAERRRELITTTNS